jgi:CheY-like chemotaxis protein
VSTFANDGDSALTLIKDNAFDLVFMDCIMPEKDGFETTVLIREYEETLKLNGELEKELTIIGNTSLTAPSEIDKCIQSGMDTVLNKPYKKEKLLELLERYK